MRPCSAALFSAARHRIQLLQQLLMRQKNGAGLPPQPDPDEDELEEEGEL